MTPRDFRSLATGLTATAMVLNGCGNLDDRRFDHPQIRELQQESVSRFPGRPIRGESITDFFSDKVGLIEGAHPQIPSGRAIPVGKDGYYLTAWHVVSGGDYHLSDLVILRPPPKNGTFNTTDYLRWDSYPGRLVWHDEKADLAIVKFDHRPAVVFTPTATPATKGTAVFSGASGRNSGTLLSSSTSAAGIGNGPFATAGTVTRVRPGPLPSHDSTLVGRGGMSGAPVVDESGGLAGVVTSVHSHLFSTPTTRFSMIPPRELDRILTADRAANR